MGEGLTISPVVTDSASAGVRILLLPGVLQMIFLMFYCVNRLAIVIGGKCFLFARV